CRRTWPADARVFAEANHRGGRLAEFRAVHGPCVVCAHSWLLQRWGTEIWARRRFHHGAGSLESVWRLRGDAVRGNFAAVEIWIEPGDRRRQRPARGGCSGAPRVLAKTARALLDSRNQRRASRSSA